MTSLKLLAVLSFMSLVSGQEPNPVVKISHGLVQGSWKKADNGKTYASFEGVPYASPPVGEYRFREPQQMKPWTGVWDATKPLSVCIQYDPFIKALSGSENCLFINVYTSQPNAKASLPVVAYIHGGAFMFGGGSLYDPWHLMDKDVVVVTFNYRLGPLGFLSTGDEVAPGNFGLKDQAFALKWIQDNIAMFGGNPNSVTLTGCSAGSASVNYQYLSPLSKGTFHRGVAFSGAAFAPWSYAVKPAEKAKTLATIVGCPVDNNREMVECLRQRPAEVVVNAQVAMFDKDWKVYFFTPFTPTAEAHTVQEPFLTQPATMHDLPLITSVTSEEGLYPGAAYQSEPNLLNQLEENWVYNDTLPPSRWAEAAAKIKQHYLAGKPVSQDTFPQLIQALGDRLFVVSGGKLAQMHAQQSSQPTYVYRYSFRGEKSLSNLLALNDKNYGVSHGDDMFHIFKYDGLDSAKAEDMKMTHILVDMVYSYATTGVPKVGNAAWKPVTAGSPKLDYLEISAPGQAEMKSSSDFGQRSFWDNLGENERFNAYIKDEF